MYDFTVWKTFYILNTNSLTLDGRKKFPVNHGETSRNSFLHVSNWNTLFDPASNNNNNNFNDNDNGNGKDRYSSHKFWNHNTSLTWTLAIW